MLRFLIEPRFFLFGDQVLMLFQRFAAFFLKTALDAVELAVLFSLFRLLSVIPGELTCTVFIPFRWPNASFLDVRFDALLEVAWWSRFVPLLRVLYCFSDGITLCSIAELVNETGRPFEVMLKKSWPTRKFDFFPRQGSPQCPGDDGACCLSPLWFPLLERRRSSCREVKGIGASKH